MVRAFLRVCRAFDVIDAVKSVCTCVCVCVRVRVSLCLVLDTEFGGDQRQYLDSGTSVSTLASKRITQTLFREAYANLKTATVRWTDFHLENIPIVGQLELLACYFIVDVNKLANPPNPAFFV